MGGLDPRAARSDACARPLTDRQFALQTAFALTRARRMPLAQRAAASIMVADQVLDWLRGRPGARLMSPRQYERLEGVDLWELEPGMHCDGAGLYLRVDWDGGRRWSFIYQWPPRRRREMSLGPLRDVELEEARAEAWRARRIVRGGVDPISERAALRPAHTAHVDLSHSVQAGSRSAQACKQNFTCLARRSIVSSLNDRVPSGSPAHPHNQSLSTGPLAPAPLHVRLLGWARLGMPAPPAL